MTKEQIENELDAMVITKYGGKHLGYYGVLELFRKVLEDSDYKTCSSCKYWGEDNTCWHLVFNKYLMEGYEVECSLETEASFGCNRWESKK